MGAKPKFTAQQIIEALNQTKGMIYLAAKKLHCSPVTVYNYAKRYKSVQQAIDDNRGEFIDVAELALARAVQAGEGWAVCFALKTLGKKRGYVERQEVQGLPQENINYTVDEWRAEQAKRTKEAEETAKMFDEE